MAATYNNLYMDARRQLRLAGSEAAQLEAVELVAFAAGKTKSQLFRDMPLYASAQVEGKVKELLARRLAGEPVAYIIGEWEFYGLPLDISRQVIVPRDDTAVLATRAIELTRAAGKEARVLDLCAGSGCVGLAVGANCPQCRVILADISEEALRICRSNIRRNGLTARVSALQADALEKPSSALWDFDVIASNPPYIPSGEWEELDISVRGYEPRLALDGGADGLDFYRAIAAKWKSALRLGGTLLFEVGHTQAADVEYIMAQNGFEDIKTHQDTAGVWRVVEGTVNR